MMRHLLMCSSRSARGRKGIDGGRTQQCCDRRVAANPISDRELLRPFGQVPILEEDERVLFESGAMVLLLSKDGPRRARATQWQLLSLVMKVALIESGQ